jgi:hypothetical protein
MCVCVCARKGFRGGQSLYPRTASAAARAQQRVGLRAHSISPELCSRFRFCRGSAKAEESERRPNTGSGHHPALFLRSEERPRNPRQSRAKFGWRQRRRDRGPSAGRSRLTAPRPLPAPRRLRSGALDA